MAERIASIPRRDLRSVLLETRITGKALVRIELAYLMVVFFLVNNLGFPYTAVYLLDVINLFALIASLGKIKNTFAKARYKVVPVLFAALCAVLLLGDVLNMVSPTLIVWGVRNTFRFFAFFVACAVLLDLDDVDGIMRMFMAFQAVNLFVSLFQFFALGARQDELGGIFGMAAGCNGYSNVFFCLLLAYYSIQSISGKKPVRYFVFVCITTLVLAAMAELKFYFFEFPLVVLASVLLYANRVRAVVFIALAAVALILGLQVFADVFPSAYEMITNFDEVFSYSSKGMAAYELSRFNAFSEISSLIFGGDLQKVLFGVGFGGAEYSSNIAMFNSPFSQIWGYLNYRWFSHQMWFIEGGAVGFALFLSLFIAHAFYSGRLIGRCPGQKALLQFVVLFTFVTVVNLWYNCAIRVEAAYMTFFVLSISCVIAKESAFASSRGGDVRHVA